MSKLFYSENNLVNIAENLVKTYMGYKNTEDNKSNKVKILDEFIIGLIGLIMLMSDDDREHIIDIINANNLRADILKSINRLKNNESLAFTY